MVNSNIHISNIHMQEPGYAKCRVQRACVMLYLQEIAGTVICDMT